VIDVGVVGEFFVLCFGFFGIGVGEYLVFVVFGEY